MTASALYPALQPYTTEHLKTKDGIHTLEVRQYGNANSAAAAVHLHGGPATHFPAAPKGMQAQTAIGGGCTHEDAQRFDGKHYRIVTFDQRGCGNSTPSSSLEANTTQDLINDIEQIRTHLGIDKWLVFGGSWGSTLALAYAQAHPSVVTALVLRGIFLLRKEELQFFYQNGTSWLFPDEHAAFSAAIPEAERGDLITAFHKRLSGNDPAERSKAAKAWTKWEKATSRLYQDPSLIGKANEDDYSDRFARIESHYFTNGGFLRPGQLLEKAELDKIRHIPTVIVQGRYDVVCPSKSAYDLSQALPHAEFIIVPDSGHSAAESGTERELVKATDKFRSLTAAK